MLPHKNVVIEFPFLFCSFFIIIWLLSLLLKCFLRKCPVCRIWLHLRSQIASPLDLVELNKSVNWIQYNQFNQITIGYLWILLPVICIVFFCVATIFYPIPKLFKKCMSQNELNDFNFHFPFPTDPDSGPLHHETGFIMLQNVRSYGGGNNK